ncbi:(2Fe-2S) ferredoxin domain-containing protein, partial [Nitrospinae bacterium AH_259_B05_G02_I21]|nr:(2Fe-2S) ferredoxin domain-containing protein [Nitrospinae bacterium AH_259_B05_G02_I21]
MSTDLATPNTHDLAVLALAFVVRVQGSWSDQALGTWRSYLEFLEIRPTGAELDEALAIARKRFFDGPSHLFLCGGRPCSERLHANVSREALERMGRELGGSVSQTECQGPCKQAPVATLRVGERCEMFAQFAQERDLQAVTEFVSRATSAGTLLVDLGTAQPFRFDPVHDHEKPSPALTKLDYLLGHFHGEGTWANRPGGFLKEVIGAWEAGGRFLSLRMAATYPLQDGKKDAHQALVILGVNPSDGQIEARAYTDGGRFHDYHLTLDGDQVIFADRPPGHGTQAKRARKILRPTLEGYQERLEIDTGEGLFEPYYEVTLR